MGEDWFSRRTSHWRDWGLSALTRAKQDHSISLVIPARDEAATVGEIVTRIVAELGGLLDEVVVIDSDSTDATAKIAAEAGATVFSAGSIRPDLGRRFGKGEAMWKSQFVTSGDIVVFMDADLIEWDTHFVTGLLGPLLADPGIELVKGFYDRHLVLGDVQQDEGGRVTEIVARPLLSLFWPDLSWIAQPLAGEWAVRRDLLAQLPIPCGYAVELGVLVDTYVSRGMDSIAQVDLGVRTHSHQPLRDLGAMSTELLALASRRIQGEERAEVVLRQFDDDRPLERRIPTGERPPAEGLR